MYFIEEGTVSIKIQQDKGETEISKLEKGQYFGELALVTHRPRAASAYAQNHVKVACESEQKLPKLFYEYFIFLFVSPRDGLVIDVEAFERLLGPCMDLMKRNIDDYESQLVKIFGSKTNIADIR